MKNNFKIAIVAGGTGGHIFPAISLLEQLINEKKEIIQEAKQIVDLKEIVTSILLVSNLSRQKE